MKIYLLTVCYLWRDTPHGPEICLAWKEPTPSALKLGVAKKWNGYGGKMEQGDLDIKATAIRELQEESGVIAKPKELKNMGDIDFLKNGNYIGPCTFFLAHVEKADPRATSEMSKPTWFALKDLPYEYMLEGDRLIFSFIVAGHSVQGRINYDDHMKVIPDEHTDLWVP